MSAQRTRSSGDAWRDLAACLSIAAFFAFWFAPGVFGGRIYFAEDIASYFYANRSVLYATTHGAGFSWWDPLPGLGLPRLANLQNGYGSPFSIPFYLFPTGVVFSFYPALILSVLSLCTFGLFRTRGLATLPALFGALAWGSLGNVVAHVQHPPFIETLAWLPATLLAWQLFLRSGRGWWAALAGLALAFQCIGAPQFVIYNGLVMAVWIGLDLWELRAERAAFTRSLTAAVGVAAVGIGLASWQLLPSLEFAQLSHRTLLSSPEQFAAWGRAAPGEVLLAIAAESFWLMDAPPPLEYGAPYPSLPNVSLLTLGLALFAGTLGARRRLEWIAVLFFLLGMLGAAGGVTTLLGWVIPFADRIRAPIRMIAPAGFLLSWLAACGMQRFSQRAGRPARALGVFGIAWIALLGWSLQWRDDSYVDRQVFEVPEVIARAVPRIAVDIRGSQDLPLFAPNAGIAAGVPSLLPRAALRPANYFEAIFASQHGSLLQRRKLDRLIAATVIGFTDPSLPLIRSFGLRTLLRYRDGEYEAVAMPGATPRFFVSPRANFAPDPRERWAAARDARWDPLRTVITSQPVDPSWLPGDEQLREAGEGGYGNVRVLVDVPDAQSLEVESAGGLLVTSELMYPGWEVEIDGESADPLELNLALRGVLVPPGTVRVDWTYRPTWLWGAIAGSLLAAVVALAMGLLLRSDAILEPPSRG